MTKLLIARHGNTFGPNEIPTRVGARTDLPLVKSGQEQARRLGRWLKEKNLIPDHIYTSELKRTKEMAELAILEIGQKIETKALDIFNEIDYGPDENQTEDKVIARLGQQTLKDWDEKAIPPDGWQVDPKGIIRNWQDFAPSIPNGQTVLVITSNGIARFAPHILAEGFESFQMRHKIKISTGALCIFDKHAGNWVLQHWNIKP